MEIPSGNEDVLPTAKYEEAHTVRSHLMQITKILSGSKMSRALQIFTSSISANATYRAEQGLKERRELILKPGFQGTGRGSLALQRSQGTQGLCQLRIEEA